MKKYLNEIILGISGLCLILLVISIFSTLIINRSLKNEINTLKTEINQLESKINSNHYQFISEINSLESQLAEASLYYYGNSYKIDNYDVNTDIVSISYFLSVKEYSSNDKVYIVANKESLTQKVEAIANDGIFAAQLELEAKSSYDINVIIEGDTIKTQYIQRINIDKDRFGSVKPVIGITMDNDKYYADFSLYTHNDFSKDVRYKYISGYIQILYKGNIIYDQPNISSSLTESNLKQILSEKRAIYIGEFDRDEPYIEGLHVKIGLVDGFGMTYTYDNNIYK